MPSRNDARTRVSWRGCPRMDAIGDRSSADSGLGRRLVGNTLAQVVTPALRMALGIALAAVLSRYLGAEGLGSYALVFAYVATFDGVFNEWGLGTILLREISRRPEERDGLLVSGAVLQGAVACGTYALMLGALPFMHYPGPVNRAITLYGLTLFAAPLNMLSLSFQADLALARLLPASLLGALLHFTLSLVVVALHGPLLWLVVAAAGALAMQYTGALSCARRGRWVWRPSSGPRCSRPRSWWSPGSVSGRPACSGPPPRFPSSFSCCRW